MGGLQSPILFCIQLKTFFLYLSLRKVEINVVKLVKKLLFVCSKLAVLSTDINLEITSLEDVGPKLLAYSVINAKCVLEGLIERGTNVLTKVVKHIDGSLLTTVNNAYAKVTVVVAVKNLVGVR